MSCAEVIVLADFAAARWLGHGRAMELYLACVTFLYGTLVLSPDQARVVCEILTPVLADYAAWLPAPLLAHAALSGFGLAGNVWGWRWSWLPRFAGAILGNLIWGAHTGLLAAVLLGWSGYLTGGATELAVLGFAAVAPAMFFSMRTMFMAWAELPRPGSVCA